MTKRNLLINEPPLQVLPSLAKLIGLNEAIALQQLHYWLENPKAGVEIDGQKWVYNDYEEWQRDNFPFWSLRTVQRVFLNLEQSGIVISRQAANYDRTKYYRIDYDKLERSSLTEWRPPSRQNGTMEDDKVAPSLNDSETTTETNTEITGEQLEFLKRAGLEWMILSGKPITQDMIDNVVREQKALTEFERVFGFGTLPWSSNSTWEKFKKFVIKIYIENPDVFQQYVDWRKGDGKYAAYSNRKIRENPLQFIDTGYPEFAASEMYRKPAKPVEPERPVTSLTKVLETWTPEDGERVAAALRAHREKRKSEQLNDHANE